MKFLQLSEIFEKIESISSRNEMSEVLAQAIKPCDSEEIQIISYMLLGRVAPMFVKAEFNYSERSLLNLLSEYTKDDVYKKRQDIGDIGDTLLDIWGKYSIKGGVVEVKEIYEILWSLINISGTGSVQVKNKIILECIKKLSPLESKYFVRIICGQLRLGMNVRSLLDVYSMALVGDKSLKKILEHAYGVCADVGYIAKIGFKAHKGSVETDLKNIKVRIGTPIQSRLVERVGSFDELFERFNGEIYLQPKFDGLRCQIHKWSRGSQEEIDSGIWGRFQLKEDRGIGLFNSEKDLGSEVRLFTRNLEDVTEMFPEIVQAARNLSPTSFILDSEIVGWNYKKDRFLSYQETMQRRRKYSVENLKESIPVKSFVFDLLYLDGESLVTRDTKYRLDTLTKIFSNTSGGIVLADNKVVSNAKQTKKYFDEYVGKGLEGVIVKQFEGGYKPGVRNFEWVKLKKSMDRNLVDTIDMVIVGYYFGSGRRARLGLGAILCAVLNKETDTYDAICKVGTGMGDKLLKDMSIKLSETKRESIPKGVRVLESLEPDVWVEPKYVVTVDADEITRNISEKNRRLLIGAGLSLRFPRLVEFDRDKLIEDITTVKELEEIFNMKNSTK